MLYHIGTCCAGFCSPAQQRVGVPRFELGRWRTSGRCQVSCVYQFRHTPIEGFSGLCPPDGAGMPSRVPSGPALGQPESQAGSSWRSGQLLRRRHGYPLYILIQISALPQKPRAAKMGSRNMLCITRGRIRSTLGYPHVGFTRAAWAGRRIVAAISNL